MTYKQLESELTQALKLMSTRWKCQNDTDDSRTNYIYNIRTLDDLLKTAPQGDLQYALHRWYNFITSTATEWIFCEFGAIKEQNYKNHDVDIYINHIPYDVKLTTMPNTTFSKSTRAGKNAIIQSLYMNQSQGHRKQILNRLYVVVNSLESKKDFARIRAKIQLFMKNYTPNIVNVDKKNVYADIIFVDF